ncbi:hypothetical protein PUW79_14360 [Microbacterium sp. NE2HP2]|uniref:hypothetical protein n=1 Tax=Microbacterium plantarum TaxID=1816425 RepID=UPI0023671F9A|nr:hypothetical protein [Microbacterium plantarum]MDD7945823.1 hypothetical protein [Microbacterium plantarum]
MKETTSLLLAGIAVLTAALFFAVPDSVENLDIVGTFALTGAVCASIYIGDHLDAFRAARNLDAG